MIAFQICFGFLFSITGHGRKDELKTGFVNEHECIWIQGLQAIELNIDSFGHEFEHEGTDGVIE